jgi:hypothetical protein
MQVFIFSSQIDTSVVGFTTRRGGGNLPVVYAPSSVGNMMMTAGASPTKS